MKTAKQG
jgi:hypothetical protein